mmetsp:Transcript_15755/g.37011  ORF Transcript_15755/g.37011 Transcript_15755/m.37011 type:complete len:234 (+) Transcript_15755:1124-1825(+)
MVDCAGSTDPKVVAALHIVWDAVDGLDKVIVLPCLRNRMVVQPYNTGASVLSDVFFSAIVSLQELALEAAHMWARACRDALREGFPVLLFKVAVGLPFDECGENRLYSLQLRAVGVWMMEAQPFMRKEVHHPLVARLDELLEDSLMLLHPVQHHEVRHFQGVDGELRQRTDIPRELSRAGSRSSQVLASTRIATSKALVNLHFFNHFGITAAAASQTHARMLSSHQQEVVLEN